jgi:chromosome segregation ATPase
LQQKSAEKDKALEKLEQEKTDLSTLNRQLTETIERMQTQLAAQESAADGQYADGASDASDASDASSSTAAVQALQQKLQDLQREDEKLKSLQEELKKAVQSKDDVQSQFVQLQSAVKDQTRQIEANTAQIQTQEQQIQNNEALHEKQATLVAELIAKIASIQNSSRQASQSNPRASNEEKVQKVALEINAVKELVGVLKTIPSFDGLHEETLMEALEAKHTHGRGRAAWEAAIAQTAAQQASQGSKPGAKGGASKGSRLFTETKRPASDNSQPVEDLEVRNASSGDSAASSNPPSPLTPGPNRQ